jgi:Tfp pilus assembly PilM family ATPase
MRLPSILRTAAPPVAIQITSRAVSGITLTRHGGAPVISAHAIEPLPAGIVTPSFTAQNIADRAVVAGAVSRVAAKLGGRSRRAVLVLPDSVAKVSLVRLDAVPGRTDDLDQLIRWHVRKSAPFPIEEAQVSYSPGAALPGGGREYVVALARAQVVREFEGACAEAGLHAGLVDLATLSLVNTVLIANGPVPGDWLLVHVTPDYGSIVILRGQELIFFRNRAEGSDESLPDLVHQTAMYYEDRLSGGGFARVVVAGVGADGGAGGGASTTLETLRRQVEAKLGVRTDTVDPQRVAKFSDRIAADPALTITIAPLVGALAGASADA